jgi:ecdysteroid 25-hydroxylase CYP302A1
MRLYLGRLSTCIRSILITMYHDTLFFTVTSLVVFDESLNSFSEKEFQNNSCSSKLIEAAATINSLILRTDNGPQLWRHFNTPSYRKLCRAHSYIEA